jgi:prepilin-type N-terminal cleavage/methylation domain-containing protein
MPNPFPTTVISPPGTVISTSADVSRRGMSLIEVLISVAILATVLTVLAGNVFTLSVVRQDAKEEAIVHELLTNLVERVQGENLANLGARNDNQSHLNAWSWHRRLTPRWPETIAGVNPPMTEVTPTAPIPNVADETNVQPFSNYLLPVYDNSVPPRLISPGLLSQRSGIKDLKVYLEYYRQNVLLSAMLNATEPHKTWKEITECSGAYSGQNSLIYPDDLEGDEALNFAEENNAAVLIRVVVTWSARDGGTRKRELTLARRE